MPLQALAGTGFSELRPLSEEGLPTNENMGKIQIASSELIRKPRLTHQGEKLRENPHNKPEKKQTVWEERELMEVKNMERERVKLTGPVGTEEELETHSETYPHSPYRQAFIVPHWRHELTAGVLSQLA